MNFYLNDRAVEFSLDNTDLTFYPSDKPIEFVLPIVQEGTWILTTGIWNNSEYWDDSKYWRDNPN